MKVAVSLEVTDDQRRELARRVAGKDTARLATRDDVRAFVEGAIASLSVPEEVRGDKAQSLAEGNRHASTYTEAEQKLVERLRREGKSEGYIKKWIEVGRAQVR